MNARLCLSAPLLLGCSLRDDVEKSDAAEPRFETAGLSSATFSRLDSEPAEQTYVPHDHSRYLGPGVQ